MEKLISAIQNAIEGRKTVTVSYDNYQTHITLGVSPIGINIEDNALQLQGSHDELIEFNIVNVEEVLVDSEWDIAVDEGCFNIIIL